jgi:hypothetical protein
MSKAIFRFFFSFLIKLEGKGEPHSLQMSGGNGVHSFVPHFGHGFIGIPMILLCEGGVKDKKAAKHFYFFALITLSQIARIMSCAFSDSRSAFAIPMRISS